jgi:TolB-like protein
MIYTFGHFELDTAQQELRRMGVSLAVEPQVFDVISCLVENRDRLVTRDELIEAVWAGRFVSDTTVTSRIKAARQALEDNGQDQKLIRTAPRRGFRFVADVSVKPEARALEPSLTVRQLVSAEPDLLLPDKPSVAVMPFANLFNDPEQELLVDGIVEDVIGALSRFTSLFVINRGSTFSYKGQATTAAQVSKDLGVRYIVEGSLRKSGNRVRITVQLVDAVNNASLFSEQFDGVLDDVFELQDQITERVVMAIAPEIEAQERARVRRLPVSDLSAWELYQRGLWHTHQLNADDFLVAVGLFKEAIAISPTHAAAHGQLAYQLVNAIRYGFGWDHEETMERIEYYAKLAIGLDSLEANAYLAQARALVIRNDFDTAISQMKFGLALNPSSSRGNQNMGWVYGPCTGQFEKAVPFYETALRVSPRGPQRGIILFQLAVVLRGLGRYEEAIDFTERGIPLFPKAHLPKIGLAISLAKLNRWPEAKTELQKILHVRPSLTLQIYAENMTFVEGVMISDNLETLRQLGLREE